MYLYVYIYRYYINATFDKKQVQSNGIVGRIIRASVTEADEYFSSFFPAPFICVPRCPDRSVGFRFLAKPSEDYVTVKR